MRKDRTVLFLIRGSTRPFTSPEKGGARPETRRRGMSELMAGE